MSKVEWDKKTGGVILTNHITGSTLSTSPRPVFHEELDLLNLKDFGWKYPACNEPLLWACNKEYFYRGECVFEVRGANVYDSPIIIFREGQKSRSLKPVDVHAMLERNQDQMFLLESEAIEFIRDTYMMYSSKARGEKDGAARGVNYEALLERVERAEKQKMALVKQDCDSFDIVPLAQAEADGRRVYQSTKIDKFLASFSGGKDSQVVLDLCTRALPPEDFEVIYSDTGYELPPSLKLYRETIQHYQRLYPKLNFSTAKNHASVLSYWDKIGTPSDTHRWCCSVMKTAPLYRMLKTPDGKQARVLTFDGVRAEESTRRAGYARIGKGVKHSTVINASPILYWNAAEIFLYLFKYQLPINPAYRHGMTRVGCLICPFSSEWNDMVSHKSYAEALAPFLTRIERRVQDSGVRDVEDYIKQGNWKRRAGGRDMSFPSHLEIKENKPHVTFILTLPQKNIFTWLEAVGKYYVDFGMNGSIIGELRYDKQIYKFEGVTKGDTSTVTFYNAFQNPVMLGLLKRVFYKSTYCVDCTVCEVECPTGALSILPKATINADKCAHCHKCLTFHAHGCIAADSLSETGNHRTAQNTDNMKLISYNNFGMNADWTDNFFSCYDRYFEDNLHGLNPKQILPNFVKWLVQAEILDDSKNKKITALGRKLADAYINHPDLIWQIIWINLSYNAPIAKWYKQSIEWETHFTQGDIEELLKSDYADVSPKTAHNILYALFRTFKESPIGHMGQLIQEEKLHYTKKYNAHLSPISVAYSLYKYAYDRDIKTVRVSDFYSPENHSGIYREFGIPKSDFETILRSLNSAANRLIIAELNMGLDNITLRDDITPLDVLNIMI